MPANSAATTAPWSAANLEREVASAPSGVGRRRLVFDTRRVFCSAGEVAARTASLTNLSEWDFRKAPVLERLYGVANLVAYHVARSVGIAEAHNILLEEMSSAVAIAKSGHPVARRLALDPFVNRIRLAVVAGDVDPALRAIDMCLSYDDSALSSVDEGSLLFGLQLFAADDIGRLRDVLFVERLLILWRSGRLTALDVTAADELISMYGQTTAPVSTELRVRLAAARRTSPPPFSVANDDTLKRALHRAVVYIDELAPAPEAALAGVVKRGLSEIAQMSFAGIGTAECWTSVLARWADAQSLDWSEWADRVAQDSALRLAATITSQLDRLIGPAVVAVEDASLRPEDGALIVNALQSARTALEDAACV